jgi:hypothetical protein
MAIINTPNTIGSHGLLHAVEIRLVGHQRDDGHHDVGVEHPAMTIANGEQQAHAEGST